MADCLDKEFYESLEAVQPSVEELPPKPKAGVAYIGEVCNAYLGKTRKGDPCVKVEFDIHDGESAGYFNADMQDRSQRFGADEWSYEAVSTHIKSNNFQMKIFKGIVENIEKSNKGFSFTESNRDLKSLIGKIVGIAFKTRKLVDQKTGEDRYILTLARTYTIDEIKEGKAKLPKSTNPSELADDMIDNSSNGSEPDIPF